MVKVVKTAPTTIDLHPLLINRWSPRAFDQSYEISSNELNAILEAARIAPSSYNEQPWRFIVGKRGDETFNQIFNGLVEFNQTWAKNSSALLLVVGTKFRNNGKPILNFQYDLGLAVSQGTFEAHHRGFITHQMSGFDHETMANTFGLIDLEPIAVVAIGKQGDSDVLPEQMAEREKAQSTRKDLSELIIRGSI